ncbi:MAG: glycosyltransferase family A protein [Pyrobaculum arsenaticum]|uniref:Glycosyl transferase, family 2 n=2 Tax=Pyrobaculum arsenaticum TaxID=121277 RepID=A4WHU7_PYRAR|nr:glycosyltransferase family A protein [Pyrobaculum arsenaticum]ABP49964.1 glycosyl transferase, family 2 [Pyrobaculum arsenaticum DSM 13514]MCY0891540.1 glycosyltransferase family A protein [Pyrobaculum arsenaticum]NYR16615.1 glycosyltransferase family 2 protein [Pyrobaculum arsenaticum]
MLARISIIIPSLGTSFLEYLISSLRRQSARPWEIILVMKADEKGLLEAERLCSRSSLNCSVVEQRRGYFTTALNMGKREARGDIVVFTDEDAIAPRKWIERYIKLHSVYKDAVGISSRDIYVDLDSLRLLPTPDDKAYVKLYRWIVRPWLDNPHPLFRKYRLGMYITKNFDIAHGPCIPNKTCYSLPFRGVNMSFKNEYIQDVWFPEHPRLKRAPGNEQYFGIQLALKNLDCIYTPNNPVLHIHREESLSRTSKDNIMSEYKIMKILYRQLLNSS